MPFTQLFSEESDTDCQPDPDKDSSFDVQLFALGKARPFPDGSEAIIIDSALAHDTFLGMVSFINIVFDIKSKTDKETILSMKS
jgi:hypothetical protein